MRAVTRNIENFHFELLSQIEMIEVRGGVEPPKTRDKDIYDFEED